VQALNTAEAQVLRAILDQQPLTEAKIRFAWRLSAGPTLAASTSVSWSEDRRLRVAVKSDEWRRELLRARPLILERLRELVGKDAVKTMHILRAGPRAGSEDPASGRRPGR
jgi:predicted nucleic acid-binding Zn ribbon protein